MKPPTPPPTQAHDVARLESMAVGPYCLFNDLTSTESSHRDSLSPPSDDVAVADMDGPEYGYIDGMNVWPAVSADGMHFAAPQSPSLEHNGVALNNHWEDFLQYNPTQGDSISNPNAPSQPQLAHTDAQRQSLYNRRSGTMSGQPSLELPDGIAMSAPTTGIPFAFGHPMSMAPAFDFTNPASSLVSPIDMNSLPFSMHNERSSSNSTTKSPVGSARGSAGSPYTAVHFTQSTTSSLPAPVPAPAHHGVQRSPDSTRARVDTSDSSVSSPDEMVQRPNMRKRKSDNSEDSAQFAKGQPVKKTAHNMIEKRYRTNLNDKIAALRDSVPSLRVMSRTNGNEDEDDPEDLEGLTPAHKLNKATVLSKATEYIRHLERRNKKLQDELTALKQRMDSYEKMTMTSFSYPPAATPEGVSRYEETFVNTASKPTPDGQAPQGMIRVPEEIQALHRAGLQHSGHYATSSGAYPPYAATANRSPPQNGPGPPMVNGRGSSFMNKMMVGSLAGLMLFEGFTEHEKSGEAPEGRGLFAMPISLLSEIGNFLFPKRLLFGASPHDVIAMLKLFLILGAFIQLLIPMLDFKPKPKKTPTVHLSSAPSLASPVEVRRKAWLTAIQTVWVPQHQFVLEVAALLLKTLKLSTRKLIGWHGYAFVWNVTKEQEDARVKAWDIALDAQLTGGDAEISISRLILTLLASGTLPDSPARLMLKALHIRVLLWEVAKAGYGTWYMFDELSMKLARRYWNFAKIEHKTSLRDSQDASQQLPPHLVALLELECDEVLVKPIVQRAYNLAWNKPSAENTLTDESTDGVVEDFAISSPLDALAAWLASLVVNNVIEHSLVMGSSDVVLSDLDTALAIAPPTSAVQVRALAAKAVLAKKDRLQNIEFAYKAMPSSSDRRRYSALELPSPQPLLMITRSPISADVPTSLILAKCLALVETELSGDQPGVQAEVRRCAIATLLAYRPNESDFTLLSFAAAYKVLEHFSADPVLQAETRLTLEKMANCMRVWIGKDDSQPIVRAMNAKIRTKVIKRCLLLSKLLIGIAVGDQEFEEESDAGYGSLGEEEKPK